MISLNVGGLLSGCSAVGSCYTEWISNILPHSISYPLLSGSSNICTPWWIVLLAKAVVITGCHTQLIYGSNSIRLERKWYRSLDSCWHVVQWGLSDNIQRQTITFPISFPKSCYHVTWMAISTVTNAYQASGYVNSVTRNSFYVTADNINCQKYWLAIGV